VKSIWMLNLVSRFPDIGSKVARVVVKHDDLAALWKSASSHFLVVIFAASSGRRIRLLGVSTVALRARLAWFVRDEPAPDACFR
jgi:hypothetical protein